MNEYVLGFLFGPGGYVALVRKAKPNWQVGRLNGLGGKVEKGETPVQAMVRECREETGTIETGTYHWRCFAHMINSHSEPIHCFVCHYQGLPPALKPCEEEPVNWYSPKDLPANVIHNLRWLIPLAQDYTAGFFTLDYRLKL